MDPGGQPPIVGGYVYSAQPLNLDDRVALTRAQAYRRVGRQTQKVEFMWLRGVLSTDPLVLVDADTGSRVQSGQLLLNWKIWHVSGGIARGLTVTTDPSLGTLMGPYADVMPGAHGTQGQGTLSVSLPAFRKSVKLQEVAGGASGQLWLVIRYRHEWDCEWESRRHVTMLIEAPRQVMGSDGQRMDVPNVQASGTPEFSRRIVSLPPKRFASPP